MPIAEDYVMTTTARPNAAPLSRRLRVALYSHDAQGLGHTRRNLALATAISRMSPTPDVLLFTGAPEAVAYARPPGCDIVSLPGLIKHTDGRYAARHLSTSLDDLTSLRSSVLFGALASFAPNVLIVDKYPRGAFAELEVTLDLLTLRGTRIVLGLRDVLDEPGRSYDEWRMQRGPEALDRWYDQVWVYGDPRVCDPVPALHLPWAAARKVVHTGYLAHGRGPSAPVPAVSRAGRRVLGLVGGGSDGAALAESFAAAPFPSGTTGILVTGPHMPAEDRARVEQAAQGRSDLEVKDFASDLDPWLAQATAVVTMGGYNSICEVLARGLPTLVVPRVHLRREQLLRAERMSALGLLDVLHPDDASPARLGSWISEAVRRPRRVATDVDLDGLARIPDLVSTLVAGQAAAENLTEADVVAV